ncbi:hypothetical protein CLV92_114109 [Kineococcus xinjiangensis]|uniref:Helicase/UvrB N-terminal domain-containing protein n=1 Tax=Kineococcus xinjiangensis TaxID=512762 RepID=A0A2S6IE62_9ACTN|nr:DEAD/DEAH box helicase family protein [Kineococcus xinjiangensis]PPK92508.1 hypothetical protein CLV92_114109 [Kineococcus xinjiangensis]
MTSLPAYQKGLVRRLHEASGHVAVVAPVGAGVRAAVIDFLESAGHEGAILIVTDRVDIASQWMHRLQDRSLSVRMLSSRADAIEWAGADSDSEGTTPEIAITTVQRLNSDPIRKGLVRRQLEILVVDVSTLLEGGVLYRVINALKETSRRSIFLGSTANFTSAINFDAVLEIPLADVMRAHGATLTFERILYVQSPRDAELLSRATALLERLGQSDTALSLQGAHTTLIDAVANKEAEGSGEEGLIRDAWELIDELEGTSGDSRLAALLTSIGSSKEADGWTIVLSHRLAEQEYVASALSRAGMVVVAPEIDSAGSSDFFGETLQPRVLVASPRRLAQLSGIPVSTVVIWGAPPDQEQLQEILLWAALRRSKLTLLHVSEPNASEARTMAAIERACMEFERQLSMP